MLTEELKKEIKNWLNKEINKDVQLFFLDKYQRYTFGDRTILSPFQTYYQFLSTEPFFISKEEFYDFLFEVLSTRKDAIKCERVSYKDWIKVEGESLVFLNNFLKFNVLKEAQIIRIKDTSTIIFCTEDNRFNFIIKEMDQYFLNALKKMRPEIIRNLKNEYIKIKKNTELLEKCFFGEGKALEISDSDKLLFELDDGKI